MPKGLFGWILRAATVIAAAAGLGSVLYALMVHGAGTAFTWLAAWGIGITAAWATVILATIGWRVFRVAARGIFATLMIAMVGLIAIALAALATGVGSAAVNGTANFIIDWVTGPERPATDERPKPRHARPSQSNDRRGRRHQTANGQTARMIGRKQQIDPTRSIPK